MPNLNMYDPTQKPNLHHDVSTFDDPIRKVGSDVATTFDDADLKEDFEDEADEEDLDVDEEDEDEDIDDTSG